MRRSGGGFERGFGCEAGEFDAAGEGELALGGVEDLDDGAAVGGGEMRIWFKKIAENDAAGFCVRGGGVGAGEGLRDGGQGGDAGAGWGFAGECHAFTRAE